MPKINEESNANHKYGCVMLFFAFPEMDAIHEVIKPEDVYTSTGDRSFGLEDQPHTTLLYGLHPGVTDEDVRGIIDNHTFKSCRIHNPSLFKQTDYDVLKFDVEGDSLHESNEGLKQHPYTTDFPDYHPHMTIGYLKSGMGEKYIEILNKAKANEFKLIPTHVVYGKPDGTETELPIKID